MTASCLGFCSLVLPVSDLSSLLLRLKSFLCLLQFTEISTGVNLGKEESNFETVFCYLGMMTAQDCEVNCRLRFSQLTVNTKATAATYADTSTRRLRFLSQVPWGR